MNWPWLNKVLLYSTPLMHRALAKSRTREETGYKSAVGPKFKESLQTVWIKWLCT